MHYHGDNFQGLGIAPKLLDLLKVNGFEKPTPIQHQCIPLAIEGKDIIGIAQTGTGKTLAFGIPMLQSLVQDGKRGLVVVPTRELALQVEQALSKFAHGLGLKTVVLIGGESMGRQIDVLRSKPHVVVATPGRLIDHLEQRMIRFDTTRILVLDEADRMLDMGFLPQIKTILQHVPQERQTMLFSATMPPEIVSVAAHHMKLPVRVEVAPAGTAAEDVIQELFFVDSRDKFPLIETLLSEYHGSVLVFTRTRFAAKRLARQLRHAGYKAAEIHSDRTQAQRREALDGFRIGRYRLLVATDIAARGIDVSGIELVVNYDLPANGEDYVHRIGRTGRAGAIGNAISFAMPHQRAEVKGIEQVIRTAVRVSPLPRLTPKRLQNVPRIDSVEPSFRKNFKSPKSGKNRSNRNSRNFRPGKH